jgi:hypothetical protein
VARRPITSSTLPPATDIPSSLAEAHAVISSVRANASARKARIPEPPEEPLPAECCERGCERCVFTVYYEAIDAWRREIEELISTSPSRKR